MEGRNSRLVCFLFQAPSDSHSFPDYIFCTWRKEIVGWSVFYFKHHDASTSIRLLHVSDIIYSSNGDQRSEAVKGGMWKTNPCWTREQTRVGCHGFCEWMVGASKFSNWK